MARGWYGLYIGDRVFFNGCVGEIIHLFKSDKNRGIMKTDGGNEQEVICEWCKKLD